MLYVLQAQDGRYYNGRADNWNGNLTEDKRDAFAYSREVAEFRANNFNSFSKVHGFKFEVVKL